MSVRRNLTSVTAEDVLPAAKDGRGAGGSPKLYAYGRKWIARTAGRCDRTVRDAINRGDFDPGDPIATVRWCERQRLLQWLAEISQTTEPVIGQALAAGSLDIGDAASVLRWALERRGCGDLAPLVGARIADLVEIATGPREPR